jgi:4-hydroxybenzoate polyprenyltransferase
VNGSRTASVSPRASLFSTAFARDYVITMRPYLLFVSGITGVTGLALTGTVPAGAALVLGLAFFLSYGFGQAFTDCFQLDTDSLSAPYRPLVKGTIRRTHVLAVSLAGLVLVGGALVAASRWNAPLVAAAIVGLATYSWFKRRAWAGPFYNAGIVLALFWTGVLGGLGAGRGPLAPRGTLVAASVAVFFAYADFVLTGYFKDVSADRKTGYRTLPVAAGRSVSCLVSDVFAVLAFAGAVLAADASGIVERVIYSDPTAGTGPIEWMGAVLTVGLIGAGGLASALGHVRLHGIRADEDAHRAVGPVVIAYVLLLAGVTVAHRPLWGQVLLPFLVAFFVTLGTRPARQQI